MFWTIFDRTDMKKKNIYLLLHISIQNFRQVPRGSWKLHRAFQGQIDVRAPETAFQCYLGVVRASKASFQGQLGVARAAKSPFQSQLGVVRAPKTPFQGRLGTVWSLRTAIFLRMASVS